MTASTTPKRRAAKAMQPVTESASDAPPSPAAASPTAAPVESSAAPASDALEASASQPDSSLTQITVKSVRPQGRRRAGRAFGPEPIELHVSEATLKLLQGDPQLVVEIV